MTKQSTRYCFTLNNYTDNDIELLRKFYAGFCKYLVYGKEVGEKCRTPHLQGFFTLKTHLSMVAVHKALGTKAIALLTAKGKSAQAAAYCKKGEQSKDEWDALKDKGPNYGLNFNGEEFGEVPYNGKRSELDELCEAVQQGKPLLEVSQINPSAYVRNYRGLANLRALNSPSYTHHECRGIWIWGPPGTGKSTKARSLCSEDDLFIKSQSKWWDGYSGQTHVLLDDMDSNCLGHYLKIWADKFACPGEIKGGFVNLTHRAFIVTSNKTIAQLWPDDPVMATAIKRRFKVEHMATVVDPVLLREKELARPTVPSLFRTTKPLALLQMKTDRVFEKTPPMSRKHHCKHVTPFAKPLVSQTQGTENTENIPPKDTSGFSSAWSHIRETAHKYSDAISDVSSP